MVIQRFRRLSKDPLNEYDLERLMLFVSLVNEEKLEEMESEDCLRCPICVEDFKVNDEVLELPSCKHSYHPECCIDWLKKNGTCPLCRTGVKGHLLREFHG